MSKSNEERLVPVAWPEAGGAHFVAGIAIKGEDKPGLLIDISHSITSYENTNIKSVNMSSGDSVFTGTVMVYVNNLDHLNRLIEKLKKHKAIFSAERFDIPN